MKPTLNKIKKVAQKKKQGRKKNKQKSLLKVKGESRTTLAPYGRAEYLDHFKKFLKEGKSHKQAQAATIQIMKEDGWFEMNERRSN